MYKKETNFGLFRRNLAELLNFSLIIEMNNSVPGCLTVKNNLKRLDAFLAGVKILANTVCPRHEILKNNSKKLVVTRRLSV